jgi:hypothetical protein
MTTVFPIALNGVIVALLLWVAWRVLRPVSHARVAVFALCLPLGLVLAAACAWVEVKFFGWLGVSSERTGSDETAYGAAGSLLAMLVFSAPLEEGLKLLVVWPMHAYRHLITRADSLLAALSVAAGFALFAGGWSVFQTATPEAVGELLWLRVCLASWAHLFFAGVWAYVLGDSHLRGWFQVTWLGATLFHGMYDHIVLVRSAGTLVVVVPILLTTAAFAWVGLRVVGALPRALQWSTVGEGRLTTRGTTLRWRWVVGGAFVSTGILLVAFLGAVLVGHGIGLDFAAANEEDVRANGPLLLLGLGVLSAFPLAGYLLAVASSATRISEPATGVALSVVIVMGVLSLATPTALVFLATVAPAALALGCVGAWFGCS